MKNLKNEKNLSPVCSTVCGKHYGPAESLAHDDSPASGVSLVLADDCAISSWLNFIDCSLDEKQTKKA
jgi:hypothetical protein